MALEKHVGDRLHNFVFNLAAQNRPLTVAQEENENTLSVGIQASNANTDLAYVGDRNGASWELNPGEEMILNISRVSEIYARGTPGDKLNIVAVHTTGELSRPQGA